jgi:hypothetical protein
MPTTRAKSKRTASKGAATRAAKKERAPEKRPAAKRAGSTRAAATRAPNSAVASRNITRRIAELADWRGETLAAIRRLIHQAEPEIVEEWKWMGTPVWSRHGGVCTGESYKEVVKLTFFRGAALPDPARLFNSSLEGNTRRAIDLREGERLDEAAFTALIRAAVAANSAHVATRSRRASAKA